MMINSTTSNFFPFSTYPGADFSMINSSRIQQLILQKSPLSKKQLETIIQQHLIFLQHGGAGGSWKIIHLKGIVVALYFGKEVSSGKQASFELQQLPIAFDLSEAVLPFANFCSSRIEQVNFHNANLAYSIFTDVMAKNTNFRHANLAYTDFSRGDFENANFENANLVGADFENSNLRGANFKGAQLNNAKFPGTDLTNVQI